MPKNSGRFVEQFRVKPEERFRIRPKTLDQTPGIRDKIEGRTVLKQIHQELIALQEVLYAQAEHALLVVFQAIDTGGKDGCIRRVLGPLNPQGVRVSSFKQPSPEELSHDYLWRIHSDIPARGMIRVFNRSHYEDVITVRVHELIDKKTALQRCRQINDFERYLSENGVTILKFFLNISRDEQRERLQARLDTPEKHWKFSTGDLAERELWDNYMSTFETTLNRTSTSYAPWYAVPANRKWYRDVVVGYTILRALRKLRLDFPPPEPGLDEIVVPE